VTKAQHLLALRSSRLRPSNDAHASAPIIDYFPMSAVLRNPLIPASAPSRSSVPRVNFIAADWVVSTDPAIAGPYDFILALNVLKWIHLEHLDAGVATFFQKCSAALATGGYLVIELQTWDSYQKAVRSNAAPHFAANLASLKYRPETSFPELLLHHGFNLCATSTQLRRQINIYRKA
jgi:7SK snRNA methylphosphate capping enzyme